MEILVPKCEVAAFVIETINFTMESLVFKNMYLNCAHSISDIKLPWSHVSNPGFKNFKVFNF